MYPSVLTAICSRSFFQEKVLVVRIKNKYFSPVILQQTIFVTYMITGDGYITVNYFLELFFWMSFVSIVYNWFIFSACRLACFSALHYLLCKQAGKENIYYRYFRTIFLVCSNLNGRCLDCVCFTTFTDITSDEDESLFYYNRLDNQLNVLSVNYGITGYCARLML